MKKKLLITAVTALVAGTLALTGCSVSGAQVYDADGDKMGSLKKDSSKNYTAYMEIVKNEAVNIMSETLECSEEEAKAELESGKYEVHTAFDKEIYQSLEDAYNSHSELSFGSAVTDLNGYLVAAYSGGPEKDSKNFAVEKTAPYSSFKPISVYLPAFESGTACWSKLYMDSPVKKITEADGTLTDWPSNSTGTYTNANVSVQEAVQKSINTVAVRCLSEYGVAASMDFMERTYGLNLRAERERMAANGADEILGNVALGYLQEGVSPVDMAGYYQSFANGGKYSAPAAVTQIIDKDGFVIYQKDPDMKQIITPEAAYVMNQMLQTVLEKGGTGIAAAVEDVAVAGKTGSGPKGNWFVGVTPKYSCAVWHGQEEDGNFAPEIFSEIVSAWECDDSAHYPVSHTVSKSVYCLDSGSLAGSGCKNVETGYYMSVAKPALCDKH